MAAIENAFLSVEYDDIVAAIMMPVMRDDFQEAIAALPDLNEKRGWT